jgi:competence protein ComGC
MIRAAFTVVELLVVVTIIVVLLALLTPALDRAIYQTELTVCATQQHGIGTGASIYAMDHRRRYPIHIALESGDAVESRRNWETPALYFPSVNFADDRPIIKGYIELKLLLDPMVEQLDLLDVDTLSHTLGSYSLWYGWHYEGEGGGVRKIGDRLRFKGDRFNVLASDFDMIDIANDQVLSSHPDKEGRLSVYRLQDQQSGGLQWTASFWFIGGTHERGPIDKNVLSGDLSVERFDDLQWSDPRMTVVSSKFYPEPEVVGREHLPAE